ncbi:MAG: hypothetical protein K8T10_14220 [Candidatus Eremiobacteraeota bacterium]|nr:hypothetical protein [Candidatus Eremiobacteraeota bacterium]
MNKFLPHCIPLAIGSFPGKCPQEALDLICKYFPEIPLWPQLPMSSEQEQMYIQYHEKMPGISYNEKKKKLFAEEIDEEFLECAADIMMKAMEGDLEYFAVSPENARGFYQFLENADRIRELNPMFIKGHTTGCISFSLVVTDRNMTPILYDENYMEMVLSVLGARGAWQISKLKEIFNKVIFFIDEPYLANVGSSMVALTRDKAVEILSRQVETLKQAGALVGVHCCGNTDWSILFDSGCDIISLDAYEYGRNFMLYRDHIKDFIENGGYIAWGIIPTSPAVDDENVDSLKERFEKYIIRLEEKGLSRNDILSHSFISPSCGLGNLQIKRARRVLALCRELSDIYRLLLR